MSRSLRILLVEDDDEDALLFQRRSPTNFRVQHVSDAASALQVLRGGGIDVCFSDYQLGAGTGLELVRDARAEQLRLPIIVITGQDIESLGENALLAGATDFLPKDDLSSDALARVARWSLIRRHVENRREDNASESTVRLMMGAPPPQSAHGSLSSGNRSQNLRRLLYLSQARITYSQPELLVLCSQFAAANARTHVTGVLLCVGNRFMQVIEGEHAVVDVLMQRIERDPRHGELAVVLDEPVSERLFVQWNMGALHLGESFESSAAQWPNLVRQAHRLLETQGMTRDSISALIHVLPEWLSRASAASA